MNQVVYTPIHDLKHSQLIQYTVTENGRTETFESFDYELEFYQDYFTKRGFKVIYNYRTSPTRTIGPHSGFELNLMLQGTKPCALFCDDDNRIARFSEYVPHRFSAFKLTKPKNTVWFFTQKRQEFRAEQLMEIYKKNQFSYDDHRKIGKLLGYTDYQINAFIRRQMDNRGMPVTSDTLY